MQIHQFSASYQPEQDRLLLRVLTFDDVETTLWFTRRLMVRLWPALAQVQADALLQREAASVVQASPAPLRQMLADYRKQELRQSADFSTPYREPSVSADRLTTTTPLLVTHVDVRPEPDAHWHLQFVEQQGEDATTWRRFAVTLDAQAMEGVMHLLEQAIQAAQWHAPFSLTPPEGTRVAIAHEDEPAVDLLTGAPRPRLLN